VKRFDLILIFIILEHRDLTAILNQIFVREALIADACGFRSKNQKIYPVPQWQTCLVPTATLLR
jgi:hypothetical protein